MSTLESRKAQLQVKIPVKFTEVLFKPYRYKIYMGGRGGAKTRSFARALIARAATGYERILCAREYQSSIRDSVHKVLSDEIRRLKLEWAFTITRDSIKCPRTGSEIIFKGLWNNENGIRSTEGITICWVEEAQLVTENSWQALIPTIRDLGSEIWISFNPIAIDDPTYKRFVAPFEAEILREGFAEFELNDGRKGITVKVGWQDNPYFKKTELEAERQYLLRIDPDAYQHIWEGFPQQLSDAIVFRRRVFVEDFEVNETYGRPYFGADWGFADDPTILVKFYVRDVAEHLNGSTVTVSDLYIDAEAHAYHKELDEIPELFNRIPGASSWPIKADSSRPETISYVARQGGFNISSADKWDGSVEDGITHMKAYRRIIVRPSCSFTHQELRLYSYKVDKKTNDILPVLVDKHNHAIDAIRYGLDGVIQNSGNLGVWKRFADVVRSAGIR